MPWSLPSQPRALSIQLLVTLIWLRSLKSRTWFRVMPQGACSAKEAERCAEKSKMILDAFKLADKVALVTGASAGLGAAVAVALTEAGANVVCHGNSRSPQATCERIAEAGGQGLPITGDLENRDTPRRLIQKTLSCFDRLDILVNNAGIIRRAPAVDHAAADWEAVIEVNLSSVFRLSQLAGQHMIEQGSGGKIINIASLLSFQGGVNV